MWDPMSESDSSNLKNLRWTKKISRMQRVEEHFGHFTIVMLLHCIHKKVFILGEADTYIFNGDTPF